MGFSVKGFDICPEFVAMCRKRGLDVSVNNFINFQLADGEKKFNGVFSLAALFHLPRIYLKEVLSRIHDNWLAANGVLMVSFIAEEEDFDGPMSDGRWANILSETQLNQILESVGFKRLGRRVIDGLYNGAWVCIACRK